MKIQPISIYKPQKISFNQYNENQDWDYDYGTYYNNISVKDAFVSAGVVSAVCLVFSAIAVNESEVKKIVKKGTNFIKTLVKI